MAFRIEYTPEAVGHLAGLTAREARSALDAVDRALRHEPTVPARNRKPLRANSLAPWELRVGSLRVYFDVEEDPVPTVTVRAVGVKVRDRVLIAGEEVDLG
jgi:mRNA-degrading endonuclease RelE of RelBE toxin-antitoxin system